MTDAAALHRVFLDRADLVVNAYRFAGTHVNPGVFFSLSPDACLSELLHYHPDLAAGLRSTPTVEEALAASEAIGRPHTFFTGEGSFDRILDLTDPAELHRMLQEYGKELVLDPRRRVHTADIVLTLADQTTGGNYFGEVIGRVASRGGYNGIRFFSARALDRLRSRCAPGQTYREALQQATFAYADLFEELLDEMQRECSNVVLFSGAYAVQRIIRYRFQWPGDRKGTVGRLSRWFGRSRWRRNSLHRRPLAEVEGLMVEAGGMSRAEMERLGTAVFRGFATVASVAEQLEALVVNGRIGQDAAEALRGELHQAQDAERRLDIDGTARCLQAFIETVGLRSGKGLPTDAAEMLIDVARVATPRWPA